MAQRDAIARARPGKHRTSVLGGHLQLALPAGVTRVSDDELQTTFTLDEGSSRLSVVCSELLATATELRSAVTVSATADMFTPKPFVLEPLSVPAPLVAIGLRPVVPVDRFETNLVFSIYVQAADRTVQHIGFYLEGDLATHAPACQQLARAIATTLRAGRRTIGGVAQVCFDDLVLRLPAGWVVREAQPSGSSPARVERLVELGEPAVSGYVLTTNDARYLNARLRVKTWQRTPTVILGEETEWRCFEHTHQMAQAVVRHPRRHGTFVDVRGTAERREDLALICRLLEGLMVAARGARSGRRSSAR